MASTFPNGLGEVFYNFFALILTYESASFEEFRGIHAVVILFSSDCTILGQFAQLFFAVLAPPQNSRYVISGEPRVFLGFSADFGAKKAP